MEDSQFSKPHCPFWSVMERENLKQNKKYKTLGLVPERVTFYEVFYHKLLKMQLKANIIHFPLIMGRQKTALDIQIEKKRG